MGDHALPDGWRFDLAEFERQSGGDVCLLAHGLTDEKLTRLAVVVREAVGTQPAFGTLFDPANGVKPRWGDSLGPFAEGIWLIVGAPDRISHGHMAVLLEVSERAFGGIDRNVGEVGASQAL